ncbi:glycoside hydrolase family 3 protein [Flagelloscypha sp. PMI_526]|nr:glycoside hydrolase family 3 protein [Flagelloscypha sp. PMI_526]
MPLLTDTLKREIGQHFIVGFHGLEASEDIKTLIRDYHVGHIILMRRNMTSVTQTRSLILHLQSYAQKCGHERPLMIGTDQENGLVSAFSSADAGTTFPGAMALASASVTDATIVSSVAQASGKELKAAGITWAFAPVADINSEMNNPVIGVRSFGDDPSAVAENVKLYSNALIETGVAACAKHFPGHGDTAIDSHLGLPVIQKDLSSIAKTELTPFIELIKDGIPSIMTGHIALPYLEPASEIVPASLSRTISTGLLRENLGYNGLVVTDCLEMDAISQPSQGGCGVQDGALRSLQAGADVAMICHTFSYHVEAVKRVWKAVEDGEYSFDEHNASLARIRLFKDRFVGSWDKIQPSSAQEAAFLPYWNSIKAVSRGVSSAAYNASVALISDAAHILPLHPSGQVVLYTPPMERLNNAVDDAEGVLRDARGNVRNTAGASFISFAQSIRSRLGGKDSAVDHRMYSADDGDTPSFSPSIQAVIFVLRNAHASPWQIHHLHRVVAAAHCPVIILSSCLPYDLVGPAGGTEIRATAAHVACFEYTVPALEASTALIFGEPLVKGGGRVPVTGAVV